MNPPHDPDAELAVLGGLILWPATTIPEVLPVLTASEFYLPAHVRLFSALKAIHERGEAIEPSVIIDELRKLSDEQPAALLSAAQAHGERRVSGPVRVVAQMALRRRLLGEADELRRASLDLAADPADVLDAARTTLASVEDPLCASECDDEDVDDFLSRTLDKPTPWVVHGLVRQKWRVVIVAAPGIGKTWLLREIGVKAAYGLRPFRPDLSPVRPVSTLIIDLENTDDHLFYSFDRLVKQAKYEATQERAPLRLWRRPGGIDIRKRTDRAEVEKLLTRRRPELLAIGPLKKLYRNSGSESWDLVAKDVQDVLDDWRERFTLSMVIEDHAPHGGVLRPFGSSRWESWAEVGLGIESARNGRYELMRWRLERMPTDWPDALVRGRPWPWEGIWDAGLPNEREEF